MGQQRSTTIIEVSPLEPARNSHASESGGVDGRMLEQMPKLRELREDVFFRAESVYLRNLVSLTGHNIRKACELAGLSRSRLYTLLKKYQISQPSYDRTRPA